MACKRPAIFQSAAKHSLYQILRIEPGENPVHDFGKMDTGLNRSQIRGAKSDEQGTGGGAGLHRNDPWYGGQKGRELCGQGLVVQHFNKAQASAPGDGVFHGYAEISWAWRGLPEMAEAEAMG